MAGTSDFRVEQFPISELKSHPRNYREHPDDQLEHLIQSLKSHGFYRNVIVANDNTILAGHGIIKAALKLGITHAPVIRLPIDPESPAALKVLIDDNEIEHLGEKDDRLLSELLKEIKENDDIDGLLGTGYDPMMLANLIFITRPESEIASFDEAMLWVGMPEFELKNNPLTILVHFETEENKRAFFKHIGQDYTEKTKFIWYPPKKENDIKSVRFVSENDQT